MRVTAVCGLFCTLLTAQPTPPPPLTEISLEELMNIEVTSVGKKEQTLARAAAAVYVVTQEDIRRSGATSIPQALRMVPGLAVARIDASQWAITARGFNGRFANKLLVLIDGRTVYNPLFSGVYWDAQDTLLEDIERIEVIRGPGATMWGANAVNGVINLITKTAAQTQGALLAGGGGSQERGFGGLRYGGKMRGGHYRVYGKYFHRNHLLTETRADAGDDWSYLRGGFRMDLELSPRDSLMLQGDLYRGAVRQRIETALLVPPYMRPLTDLFRPAGGDLLGRWEHRGARSQTALQVYYDRTVRNTSDIGQAVGTSDVEFQQQRTLARRHELVWGTGYRDIRTQLDNLWTYQYDFDRRRDHLVNAFVEDDIQIAEDRLWLTLGSKFEHNSFSGFEAQPTARLAWSPHPVHTAWWSVSRAVRTPSPADQSLRINARASAGPYGMAALVSFLGNRNYRSESLVAYEAGYRAQPSARVSVDLAGFYHSYDRLRSFEPGQPVVERAPQPPHLLVPINFANGASAGGYGLEVAANWSPSDRWRWSGAYTGLRLKLQHPPGTLSGADLEGDAPAHQANLRSYLDLTRNVQFDAGLYYVGALAQMRVPAYLSLDGRLGWRPSTALELSLAADNLLDRRHAEFVPEGRDRRTLLGRGLYGKITWTLP